MAFWVEDDKAPVTVNEIQYSFYQCISNGKEYKYIKDDAEAVFTKYSFDKEDSMSMLESTAVSSTEDILTASQLEAGADRLAKWKAESAAAADEERRIAAQKAAEDSARAAEEFEAAQKAAAFAQAAEEKARREKEAAEKAAAEAKAKKAADAKAKPKSMFGSFLGAAQHAFDELEKATQVAIKAIEAGLNEAQQANAKRQEELKAAKAKNDEAAAKEAFLTVATPKKLTFYEQMQLNAKKAGTTLDGLAKDAQQGVTAANTEGAAELARRNETKTKQ